MVNHIIQVGKGARKFPSVDGLRRLPGVFEGDTKVGAAGSSGFAWLDLGCCVADLWREGSICQLPYLGDGVLGLNGRKRLGFRLRLPRYW